jgi:hypothetical protein
MMGLLSRSLTSETRRLVGRRNGGFLLDFFDISYISLEGMHAMGGFLLLFHIVCFSLS